MVFATASNVVKPLKNFQSSHLQFGNSLITNVGPLGVTNSPKIQTVRSVNQGFTANVTTITSTMGFKHEPPLKHSPQTIMQ